LLAQQASDGSWSSKDYRAGKSGALGMTAFATWALADAGKTQDTGVQRALSYIRMNAANEKDPYTLALVANALVAAAAIFHGVLLTLLVKEHGHNADQPDDEQSTQASRQDNKHPIRRFRTFFFRLADHQLQGRAGRPAVRRNLRVGIVGLSLRQREDKVDPRRQPLHAVEHGGGGWGDAPAGRNEGVADRARRHARGLRLGPCGEVGHLSEAGEWDGRRRTAPPTG
jgi:hypothetical protein